jgi:hypothetical protein
MEIEIEPLNNFMNLRIANLDFTIINPYFCKINYNYFKKVKIAYV